MVNINNYLYKGGRRVVLITAIFLSSFLMNMFIKKGLDFEYLTLSIYDIRDILSSKLMPLIMYIIFKRGKQIIVIWLLMKVIKPEYVYNTLLVVCSGMFGIMATVQSYYFGLGGMTILLLFLLPHYIVYALIVKLLYDYYGGKGYEKSHSSSEYFNDNIKGVIGEKTKVLTLFVILFAIGVMCEGFFSRFFLFKYYQYMVLG